MMTDNCSSKLTTILEQTWPILILQFIWAFAGNAFAIYRFVARERTWHTGIIYSFNLAVSDLLYAFSLLPLAAYYSPPKDWKYGSAFCKLERFFFFSNLYGSAFFVACISLNRCIAVVFPFFSHGRIEPRHAKLLSGLVWLLAVGTSAPVLSFSTLEVRNGTNQTECLGSASDEQLPKYWPYSLFLLAFGCGLPFFLTSVSCVAILHAVLHSRTITRVEKHKVIMLVCVVVLNYIIFYLPFHILRNLNLSRRMHKTKDCNVLLYGLYQGSKILVHFHICAHPFIYAALANSMQCCNSHQQREVAGELNVELRLCKQQTPQ